MKHECRVTVLERKCFTDYQEKYLAKGFYSAGAERL